MNIEDYQYIRESLFGPTRRLEEPTPTETAEEANPNHTRQQVADLYGIPASFIYGDTPEQMRDYAQRLYAYRHEREAAQALVIPAQGKQPTRVTEQANPIRQLANPDRIRSEQARLPRAE